MDIWLATVSRRHQGEVHTPCLTLDLARRFLLQVFYADTSLWAQDEELISAVASILTLPDDGQNFPFQPKVRRTWMRIQRTYMVIAI